MLVLTRKGNQSIMIGDDVEVTVLSVVGEKVRIGIAAPRDVPVFRKEVYLEIQAEQAADLAEALVGGGTATVDARGTRPAAQDASPPATGTADVRGEVDDALARLADGRP